MLKKEMPNGTEMIIFSLVVGDPTMSVKELWACCRRMRIREKDHAFLEEVGQRENVPVMVMGKITDTEDVKCSGNWMGVSKLEGEGAAMYDCCEAMGRLTVADGGKDSLSMAAKVVEEVVKAPGTLVVSVYAGCPAMALTVTPTSRWCSWTSLPATRVGADRRWRRSSSSWAMLRPTATRRC